MKNAWEMTGSEFCSAVLAGKYDFMTLGSERSYISEKIKFIDRATDPFSKKVELNHCRKIISLHHEGSVVTAFVHGKPVPEHVLKEYHLIKSTRCAWFLKPLSSQF